MNRRELVKKVQKIVNDEFSPGFTADELKAVVDRTIDTIKEELQEGRTVHFRGFGSFVPVVRAGRTYRIRGQQVEAPDRVSVVFKPSKMFKGELNDNPPDL